MSIAILFLSMAWISITEAHLLTVLSGPELAGYRAAALQTSQADPVQPTIDQVTDLVRGYVGGCKANTLGEAGTIPQKLLAPALDLIAVRIPGRVGKEPKTGRKDAGEAAIKLLEQVSRCAFDIEEAVTPSTEASNSPTPSFSGRDRRDARKERDGL